MYERHFGLSAKPFQLSPDPDFFFGSRGHKRAMAYLEYGLHQGEGFIVITGEVGAGKTTLLRGLLRRLPGEAIVPAQIVSTQVQASDLLRLVAAAYGVGAEGAEKADLLVHLQRHFEALHAEGRRALLIVDEAQNLSAEAVEELRMLSNFQAGTHPLVQSFLVGQPEFRAILQRPEMQQLKQRVIASYHLGPLDRDETRDYIEHRLRHVGWSAHPHFEPAAFDAIHTATGGVPRRINLLCDRLLLAAYLGEQQEVGAEDVRGTAEELDTELGLGRADPEPPMAEVHPLPVRPGLRGAPAAGDRALADRLARLEDRVAVLESASGMTFNLLKKILRILRGQSDAQQHTGS
jgi:putative secretion ATPase (PEP-CTERM system associated)